MSLKISKLALIAFISIASSAFANLVDQSGTLHGKGQWFMPNGTKGTWTSVFTIAKAEKGATIKEVLTVKGQGDTDQQEEMNWLATDKGHGFFDISVDGKVTGWAHCDHNLCHLSSAGKEPNSRWTETLKITKHGIYRVGSDSNDQYQVTWRGVLTK